MDSNQAEENKPFDGRLSYFRFMEDVMRDLSCVNMLLRRCQYWDLFIRGFLAVFSGAGVASWFYWEEYAVYASIAVAVSQLISLLLPYFELQKKVERLLVVSDEMQELADDLENKWPEVQGAMQDDVPLQFVKQARTRQKKAMGRLLGVCHFSERLAKKAEERMNRYAKLHFYNR